ncbi:MAG: methyltransferase [Rhizobiales bacterium]|nr:methyltransferase [Hyphomicrobiales bacterium]
MPMPGGGIPLRIGQPSEFACVRGFLRDAGFDEAAVCRALTIAQIDGLSTIAWDAVNLDAVPTPLRWCIDVFLRGAAVEPTRSRDACGDATLAALMVLGLLRPAARNPAYLVCPIWLYPVDGFIVASDRRDDPDGGRHIAAGDVVFPGINTGTLKFLRLLPDCRAGDALDLCGGCGIGALHLSRTARNAVTTDVTQRSAHFADFSARLNDADVTSLCGDMYAPVQDRRFDVITAHPPFVPATGRTFVFRDGGDTGEDIIRRTIEGLPAHLRPGGTAMILCSGRDTAEATFEDRAREWLGPAAPEFDVIFGLDKVVTIDEVVAAARARPKPIDAQEAKALRGRLLASETRQFVYGALLLRRCTETIATLPLRVRMSERATAADFPRLLAWRRQCRQSSFPQWITRSHPRFAPELELTVRHVVKNGQLVPAEFVFRIEGGFPAALRPDAWIVPVLAGLDGRRSVEDAYDAAHANGRLPEGYALDDFAGLVGLMIERGFLDVELPADA